MTTSVPQATDAGTYASRQPGETGEELYETSYFFGIEYDITKALALTAGRVDGQIAVADWARQTFAADKPEDLLDPMRGLSLLVGHVDTSYALGNKPEYGQVDLDRPVLICVERGKDGKPFGKLIDGRHRLYRAWHDGREKLDACVLTDNERAQIRVNRVDPEDC